jgi:O-antigen/teichoic acid export membrane protein
VLIPLYGIEGAAAASLIANLANFATLLYFARKYVKFSVPVVAILKTIVGSTLTLLIITGFKLAIDLPPMIELFVVIIPSALFYMAWVLLSKTFEKEDLALLAKVVPIPNRVLKVAKRFAR